MQNFNVMTNTFRKSILLPTLIILTFALNAQEISLKEATRLYQDQNYADAIDMYERVLAKKKSIVGLTRLADCYRLTNQVEAAQYTYKKIVEDKKAKPKTILHYAETLMTTEDYTEAKYWYASYAELKPDDKVVANLLLNFDQINEITPYFDNVETERWVNNTMGNETYAVFQDGGIVFSSDRNSEVSSLNKKTGWTGRNFIKLFKTQMNGEELYKKPSIYSRKLIDKDRNSCYSSFYQNEIFFTKNSKSPNGKGMHVMEIYHATKEGNGDWGNIEKLSFCDSKNNYTHPAISPDGQTLYFVSDKRGGQGGADIWKVEREGKGWSTPSNLGPSINSPTHEAFPFVTADGELVFASKGHCGFGGYDIFISQKNELNDWGPAINAGKPINSSYDDTSLTFDENMEKALLTSARYKAGDDVIFVELNKGPTASK